MAHRMEKSSYPFTRRVSPMDELQTTSNGVVVGKRTGRSTKRRMWNFGRNDGGKASFQDRRSRSPFLQSADQSFNNQMNSYRKISAASTSAAASSPVLKRSNNFVERRRHGQRNLEADDSDTTEPAPSVAHYSADDDTTDTFSSPVSSRRLNSASIEQDNCQSKVSTVAVRRLTLTQQHLDRKPQRSASLVSRQFSNNPVRSSGRRLASSSRLSAGTAGKDSTEIAVHQRPSMTAPVPTKSYALPTKSSQSKVALKLSQMKGKVAKSVSIQNISGQVEQPKPQQSSTSSQADQLVSDSSLPYKTPEKKSTLTEMNSNYFMSTPDLRNHFNDRLPLWATRTQPIYLNTPVADQQSSSEDSFEEASGVSPLNDTVVPATESSFRSRFANPSVAHRSSVDVRGTDQRNGEKPFRTAFRHSLTLAEAKNILFSRKSVNFASTVKPASDKKAYSDLDCKSSPVQIQRMTPSRINRQQTETGVFHRHSGTDSDIPVKDTSRNQFFKGNLTGLPAEDGPIYEECIRVASSLDLATRHCLQLRQEISNNPILSVDQRHTLTALLDQQFSTVVKQISPKAHYEELRDLGAKIDLAKKRIDAILLQDQQL